METFKKMFEAIQNRPIHSTQEFQEIVKKERSRCDRNNQGFSLILFKMASFTENGNGIINQMIGILASRTRISDEIGWYDESNLGVLLPDTKLNGAHNLADQIISIAQENDIQTSYQLFVYPSFGWDSSKEKIKKMWL